MNHPVPLTRMAHARLASLLRPGDLAVDATAGNGHDTLFLAERVAPGGQVHAFDIQAAALHATRERLSAAGRLEGVQLHHAGHEQLAERLPVSCHGQVAAITFNLGYLPGGNREIVTLPESTLAALAQARQLLRHGGLLSILAYRGHPGGQVEADAVARWLQEQPLQREVLDSPGPVLYLATKPETQDGEPPEE